MKPFVKKGHKDYGVMRRDKACLEDQQEQDSKNEYFFKYWLEACDDDQDLAEYLDVSLPTVRRWKQGKLPHRYMIPKLIEALKEYCSETHEIY